MDEYQEPEYISYNALSRTPKVWGIPFMFFLMFGSSSLLVGMILGLIFGPLGWLIVLLVIPVFLYVKKICETDDQAMRILAIELKWFLIGKLTGNANYFGGTVTIAPNSYGRKLKNVKRYFKETVSR